MEQLNYAQVRDMLLYVTEQIIDSKALLTEVDSQIGDGDHGIGMERGKAQVGDKTMVDALEPAVERMKSCAGTSDLGEMLSQAAEAAREGMEATKNYQAKYGRAKSLMERALGHQDAGATSTLIIFRSMAEYVQKL